MTLSEELKWRGFVKDKTFTDLKWLDKSQTFYLGTDCSSDSLTVGNLAVYVLARRLVKAGWKAVLLIGGATSLIGDPGGKDGERELKPREEIEVNVKAIEQQVKHLFDGEPFTLVDNYDWFKDVSYLDFLRDVGKHYSMTELMQRDFVVQRMGQDGSGISYAEFSYSLIQGYDYWHIYKKHDAVLQIGGSDQWGNILSGVQLVRKKEGKEVHALSMPLVINKATGNKFGKSETGAIWVDSKKTSPDEFYQFWINVDDDSVEGHLKIFTELNKEKVEKIITDFEKDKAGRLAQKTLAYEVTKLVHGEDKAQQAIEQAKTLTSQATIKGAERIIKAPEITENSSIIDVLVKTGLASSKTEARQLLTNGGVYINGEQTAKLNFEKEDFKNGLLKLRRGKTLKNTVIIQQK